MAELIVISNDTVADADDVMTNFNELAARIEDASTPEIPDASAAEKGVAKLSAAPADPVNPIAVGTMQNVGGVLSGNILNPGFAVDMATQGELDAAIATRAPASHNHDDRYYTETETDAALAAKADLVAGKIPTSQIPAIAIGETFTAASEAAMLALTAQQGDVAIRTDQANKKYLLLGADASVLESWKDMSASGGAVDSVNGQTGAVTLSASDVSAAAVSHTHDASAITSGVLPIARLATGTPDGTKFIRDDGTLATPPGGSGHVIQDEGSSLAARAKLNFVGAGVTATDDSGNDATIITIPSGGTPGADGAAATIAVGTVTTGAAGSSASVTNSGTSSAAVFDFSIPQGDPGADGSGIDAETIQGVPVSETAPATGQALVFDGTEYKPGTVASSGGSVDAATVHRAIWLYS